MKLSLPAARFTSPLSSLVAAFALAAASAAVLTAQGQSAPAGQASRPVSVVGKNVPRTPDGHPDLQGVWANNMATPLERPKGLAGKAVLSDAELGEFKRRAAELFDGAGDTAFGDGVYNAVLAAQAAAKAGDTSYKKGGTGDYNSFWLVDREFENRTSLIFDPPDGRMPPLTPEAQKRNAANADERKAHPADGPENLPLAVRCLTYGVPRLGGLNAGYNSYYEFVQTRDAVAIHSEMIHEARIIPLDGRPHVPAAIRQWQGDPRGHWEGDTLVVDTTNFSSKSSYQGAHEIGRAHV